MDEMIADILAYVIFTVAFLRWVVWPILLGIAKIVTTGFTNNSRETKAFRF